MNSSLLEKELLAWSSKNKRALPWRGISDPYRIWVSEVMLQQTTVQTVIPYYKRFVKRFKNVGQLAKASLEDVLPYWSGLGYYSRVKNLHKSAQIIHKNKGFPRTYKDLLKLPGFGPYTSRAVSAFAFEEKVAVLDTNVIRVMARLMGFQKPWWNQNGRDFLQKSADRWTKNHPSALINQAFMDLGALVCSPKEPACILCPLSLKCRAYKAGTMDDIPLKQLKRKKELWLWQPFVYKRGRLLALVNNHKLPVLKKYPFFPGEALRCKKKPRHYAFVHSITHHVIYVSPVVSETGPKAGPLPKKDLLWVKLQDLQYKNPSSLGQKILYWAGLLQVTT